MNDHIDGPLSLANTHRNLDQKGYTKLKGSRTEKMTASNE